MVVGTPSIRKSAVATDRTAWRWVGWFGLVLAVAGLGDFVLTWIPLQFGSAEWEFETIAAAFSGLPLVTMGFAAMLAAGSARRIRWQLTGMGVVLSALGVVLVGALLLFLLVVPVALVAVEGPGRLGVMKAIARTLMLGVLFSGAYLAAGIGALRHARTI